MECTFIYAWISKAVFGPEKDLTFLDKYFEDTISSFAAIHHPVNTPEVQSLYISPDPLPNENVNVLNSLEESFIDFFKSTSLNEVRGILMDVSIKAM